MPCSSHAAKQHMLCACMGEHSSHLLVQLANPSRACQAAVVLCAFTTPSCLACMQVCQWVFGQEFPGPGAPLGQQVLSVGTAMIGLAAFAMVLALVEQVVLEGLEANVKRGSKVFESGHVSVPGCWMHTKGVTAGVVLKPCLPLRSCKFWVVGGDRAVW